MSDSPRTSEAGFDLDTVDRLLGTTRAVRRRLDFDRPVPREVLLDCIRLSQQAPTGTNAQHWCWLIVDDPAKRKALGEIYARGLPLLDVWRDLAGDERAGGLAVGVVLGAEQRQGRLGGVGMRVECDHVVAPHRPMSWAMIWRCTSSAPPPIRPMRASRQARSIGNSSL